MRLSTPPKAQENADWRTNWPLNKSYLAVFKWSVPHFGKHSIRHSIRHTIMKLLTKNKLLVHPRLAGVCLADHRNYSKIIFTYTVMILIIKRFDGAYCTLKFIIKLPWKVLSIWVSDILNKILIPTWTRPLLGLVVFFFFNFKSSSLSCVGVLVFFFMINCSEWKVFDLLCFFSNWYLISQSSNLLLHVNYNTLLHALSLLFSNPLAFDGSLSVCVCVCVCV